MSLVERAAKRLEELQRAGVSLPWNVGPSRAKSESQVPNDIRAGLASAAQREGAESVAAEDRVSRSVDIDVARLAENGYITPDAPRSQLADEFRVVKRPLLANATGTDGAPPIERANLIMVTSSVPGEGKTFVSVNLAMSIAMELDRRVLLIDADPSRPAVLNRLGLPPSSGLLDALTDSTIDLSSLIMRTNVERLSLLPAGTANTKATELLASVTMQRLVEDLAARYSDRIVIFDGPPLLPSTESRVLATHMGQIVFVVEAARTRQSVVSEALSTIESCPVVLPMLNKTRGASGSYGYYGY
ncbi:MAG TPA: XrtA-associated tyrosine autokinase [Burkholderiaceae bacterium]|nr:XrtA-associated tyrosine autokinase [Burkholderiaceae bacterium]